MGRLFGLSLIGFAVAAIFWDDPSRTLGDRTREFLSGGVA